MNPKAQQWEEVLLSPPPLNSTQGPLSNITRAKTKRLKLSYEDTDGLPNKQERETLKNTTRSNDSRGGFGSRQQAVRQGKAGRLRRMSGGKQNGENRLNAKKSKTKGSTLLELLVPSTLELDTSTLATSAH